MDFVLDTKAAPAESNGASQKDGWREEAVCVAQDARPAIDRLVADMAQAGYLVRDLFAVRLAVDEALVNAIKHGHQGFSSKMVRLAYRVDPHQVLLVVEDEGPGFCPEQVPNPRAPEHRERAGGRGVFLMHHYMTWVRFNDRGNCVTMCRRRS